MVRVYKKPVEVKIYRHGIDEIMPDWIHQAIMNQDIFTYPDNRCRIKPYYSNTQYVNVLKGDYIILEGNKLYHCNKDDFDNKFIVVPEERGYVEIILYNSIGFK